MAGSPIRRQRRDAADPLAKLAEDKSKIGARDGKLPTQRRTKPIAYSDELIDEAMLLGDHGLSDSEIAAHWRVSIAEMSTWAGENPAFETALARAQTAAEAWWEERVRLALLNSDNRFPAGAWAQVMRARFPNYVDRLEVGIRQDVTRHLVVVHRSGPHRIEEPGEAGISTVAAGEPLSLLAVQRAD